MELQERYKKIVENLKLLAASFEEQQQYLPGFADVPDDVTSSFENAFLLLPQLIESNIFSNSSIASLLRLYNEEQWCIRNVGLDNFSNDKWDDVRSLAKKTLLLLGEQFGRPDPKYI